MVVPQIKRLRWSEVPAIEFKSGYGRFYLREDLAGDYLRVYTHVVSLGGIVTSSGSRRSPNRTPGRNQSPTSNHLLGRALDLYVYSGMVNPETDPFIVTLDDPIARDWRVWARVSPGCGVTRELDAWVCKGKRKPTQQRILADVIDLTALFQANNFQAIPARRSFFRGGNRGGAEWWHFQHIGGLVSGKTKFGDELLRIWPESKVVDTPVWAYRNRAWNGIGWG